MSFARRKVTAITASSPTPEGDHAPVAEYPSPPNGAAAKSFSDGIYRFVVLAYIAAATMPPIGVILAVLILARGGRTYSRHVAGIVLVAIVASVIWALILASGALNVTSNDY